MSGPQRESTPRPAVKAGRAAAIVVAFVVSEMVSLAALGSRWVQHPRGKHGVSLATLLLITTGAEPYLAVLGLAVRAIQAAGRPTWGEWSFVGLAFAVFALFTQMVLVHFTDAVVAVLRWLAKGRRRPGDRNG